VSPLDGQVEGRIVALPGFGNERASDANAVADRRLARYITPDANVKVFASPAGLFRRGLDADDLCVPKRRPVVTELERAAPFTALALWRLGPG